jgi:uncharacterized repeat protein (TIGR01451 family)
MNRLRFRPVAAVAAAFALVCGAALPATGAAATPPDQTAVMTTNAVKKKVCTPAQARRKAAGKRVNCVVKPKVCKKRLASGKVVRVKCRPIRRVVSPRTAPSTTARTGVMQLNVLRSYIDEGGKDDAPGQKDLTATSSDSTATDLILTVNWDITSLNGGNTADACYLFDSDGDGFANVAICVTWGGSGTIQSVTKYTCNDTSRDRCAGADTGTALATTVCTLSTTAPDPFGSLSTDAPNTDAKATCTIPFTTITAGGTISTLINTCSYPSQEPNSAPSDCLLIPRDGFLKLTKVLVGGPAGYTGPFNLTYTCTKTGSNNITATEPVAAGTSNTIGMVSGYTCSVTEVPPTAPDGYAWAPTSPTYSTPVTIVSTQTATLTVTNTLVELPGTLIVKKVLTNNDGGTKALTAFQYTVNSGVPVAFERDGQNDMIVAAGTYSIVEVADAAYTTTYENCTNVVVPKGGTATCTITNDDKPATLHVKKILTNDNGGTRAVTSFTFSVNNATAVAFDADTQNDLTVPAGTYNVVETAATGYETTYSGCTNIVLVNGGTATCTITNNDLPGHLIVKKLMDNKYGGTKLPQDFSFSVNGATAVAFEADAQNDLTVNAGTYNVTENPGSEYTATYDGCADMAVANGATLQCTITNHDKPVTLTVEKVVVNDDGGTATADDFQFKVDGGASTAFVADSPSGLHGSKTISNLAAGNHTVTEVADSRYTTAYSAGCTTLGATNGETINCIITNNDKPATLTVVKVLTTDNGSTAVKSDFSFVITGGVDPISKNFTTAGEVVTSLPAGTYTVTETAAPGFTTSYANCADIKLDNGESATCTITNDDQQGTLTVEKVVVNNDGGTKVASDFSFQVNGGAATAFNAGGTNVLSVNNGTYTVTEVADSGYTTSYSAGCTANAIGNGQTGTCVITNNDKPATLTITKVLTTDSGSTADVTDFSFTVNDGESVSFPAGGTVTQTVSAGTYTVVENEAPGFTTTYDKCRSVTLVNGGSATCTITNDDQPATLIVTKTVNNLYGGTKVAKDFAFSVDGAAPTAFEADGSNSLTVSAGTYTVTEPATDGYSANLSNCTGIVLANGETATCAITNSDLPVTMTVIKNVINDNGGTKTAGDFTFSVDEGTATAFNQDQADELTGTNVIEGLFAGDHSVTETADTGYTTSYSDGCSTVGAPNGANLTCTITNDDKAATLIVKKVVINDNGGAKAAKDFTFSVNGGEATAFTVAGLNELNVSAGIYTVTETADTGYSTTYDGCARLALTNGQTATCTITNNDRPGTLVITKKVVNDDGGTALPTAFSYTVDDSQTAAAFQATEAAGEGTSGPIAVDAGNHTVAETAAAGYAATNGCANVTIKNGETTTCTITNDDIAPTLVLTKVVQNGTNGTATPADFTLSASAESARDIERAGNVTTAASVFANTGYQLSETGPTGYNPGAWVCTNTDAEDTSDNWSQDGKVVTLGLDAHVTCTITNLVRDLALAKTTDVGSYVPGDTIHYTVTVTNLGASTIQADEIAVTDQMLGDGLILQGEPGALAPGGSRVYTGTRAVTSEDCGEIVNTASVAIRDDAFLENNADEVTTPVVCNADLALAKTADKTTYQPGQTITYTLTVTNTGTSIVPVSAVTVTDPTLAGLTIQTNAPTQLLPQGTVTFTGTKVATKAMCGPVPNTATVAYEGDTNPENNSASVTVSVAGGACIAGPLPTTLRIVKTGPATAKHGRNVGYRLTVTNVGKVASFNTVISDTIPRGMTLAVLPKGATLSRGVITWKLGTLQPGKTRSVVVMLRSSGTRTLRRCNIGAVRADNAPRVTDPACTRFTRVAGTSVPGVTG